MEFLELPQKIQVMLVPGDDIVKVVTSCDRSAGRQQQDLLERIYNAPRLAVVPELGKCCKSRAKRARGLSPSKVASMIALQCESERLRNHTPSSTQNVIVGAVNLGSEPWPRPRGRLIFCRKHLELG
jgi:hypothetical protein